MIRRAKVGERVTILKGENYGATRWTNGVVTDHWPPGCAAGVVTEIAYRPNSAVISLIYVKADHPAAVGATAFRPNDLERAK